jgi:hypothetical protein
VWPSDRLGRRMDGSGMTKVEQLEQAIESLSPEERARFRAWYAEFDAVDWDQQFEADVAAGKLDRLQSSSRDDRFEA